MNANMQELRRRTRIKYMSLLLAFLLGMLFYQTLMHLFPYLQRLLLSYLSYLPVEPKPWLPRDVCGSSDTSSICMI